MPKVSVYLPDHLYQEVRTRGLSLSALTQRAVEAAVAGGGNDAWIRSHRGRPRLTRGVVDSAALLDEVREDFGS